MAIHQSTQALTKAAVPATPFPETLSDLLAQHAAETRTYEAESQEFQSILDREDRPEFQPVTLREISRLVPMTCIHDEIWRTESAVIHYFDKRIASTEQASKINLLMPPIMYSQQIEEYKKAKNLAIDAIRERVSARDAWNKKHRLAEREASIDVIGERLFALEMRVAQTPCRTADDLRMKAKFFLEGMKTDSGFLDPFAEDILRSLLSGSFN